jgi:hypothetical protein
VARRKPIKVAIANDDGSIGLVSQAEYLNRTRPTPTPEAALPPATTFHARLSERLLDAWFHRDWPADLVNKISRTFSRGAKKNKAEHEKASLKYALYRRQAEAGMSIKDIAEANRVKVRTVYRALKKSCDTL